MNGQPVTQDLDSSDIKSSSLVTFSPRFFLPAPSIVCPHSPASRFSPAFHSLHYHHAVGRSEAGERRRQGAGERKAEGRKVERNP